MEMMREKKKEATTAGEENLFAVCVAVANGEHPNGRRNEMRTKRIDGIYVRSYVSERSTLREISLAASSECRMENE